jgi:hypothetical protein
MYTTQNSIDPSFPLTWTIFGCPLPFRAFLEHKLVDPPWARACLDPPSSSCLVAHIALWAHSVPAVWLASIEAKVYRDAID